MSRTTHPAHAVCEAIEHRLLLASITLNSSTQNAVIQPVRQSGGDGQGNKISLNVPAVQPFRTTTFGRVDLAYQVLGFETLDGFDGDETLTLNYALWRDVNNNDAFDASDTKVRNLEQSDNAELAAAKYLYVVTPTSGNDNTRGDVRVSLKLTSVSGAKAVVTGNGQTITDGDATPTIADFTDFGTVPTGVINVDRQYTVRNTGGSTLTLGAVSAPAGFAVKAGLPPTLASGASATFTITMSTVAGPKSGVVSFGTNDPSVGTFSFNVAGNPDPAYLPAKSGLRRLRINGTNGADTITLTQNATRIIFSVNGNLYSVLKTKITRGISVDAIAGNDLVSVASDITIPVLIVGNTGNDTLIGGGGNDTLMGLAGNDVLRPGLGTDLVDGGDGGDTADYSERTSGATADIDGNADDGAPGENDTILTNVENLLGGAGNDTLSGSAGANFINGLGGKDFILGLAGDDVLRGGSGNDTLRPGTGKDTLLGESGSDMADYSERAFPVQLSNDDVANDGVAGESDNIGVDIERVAGGAGADRLDLFGAGAIAYGFGGNDTLRGTDGNDALFGGDANDRIDGFGGNDYIEGNAGDDLLYGKRGNDTIVGGIGNDDLNGESDQDSLVGEDGNDTLRGDPGSDFLRGGNGNDVLYARWQESGSGIDGIDTLLGEAGNDTLLGGDNDGGFADILDGGTGIDVVGNKDDEDQLLNIP